MSFQKKFEICAITNDIYTKEDAKILSRSGVLHLLKAELEKKL